MPPAVVPAPARGASPRGRPHRAPVYNARPAGSSFLACPLHAPSVDSGQAIAAALVPWQVQWPFNEGCSSRSRTRHRRAILSCTQLRRHSNYPESVSCPLEDKCSASAQCFLALPSAPDGQLGLPTVRARHNRRPRFPPLTTVVLHSRGAPRRRRPAVTLHGSCARPAGAYISASGCIARRFASRCLVVMDLGLLMAFLVNTRAKWKWHAFILRLATLPKPPSSADCRHAFLVPRSRLCRLAGPATIAFDIYHR